MWPLKYTGGLCNVGSHSRHEKVDRTWLYSREQLLLLM